ncbi:MAG: PKD domain-containing protein [bacterium]
MNGKTFSKFLLLLSLLLLTSIQFSDQLPVVTAQGTHQTSIASTMPDGEQDVGFPPAANAGPDFTVGAGIEAWFYGQGSSPDMEIARYAWDFDGDGGIDFESEITAYATHAYQNPGVYTATLTVTDLLGNKARDTTVVTVTADTREQIFTEVAPVAQRQVAAMAADGVVNRYAIMLNGGYETRFWDDVTFMYATLTEDYGFSPADIYLLNHEGADPWGNNPYNMIDRPASIADLSVTFDELAAAIDGDDELFVWVTDHGKGYIGPKDLSTYGYLAGHASVDPGDEQDYLERDFKLRALHTGGHYIANHGMDVYQVVYYSSIQTYYRHKYVSRFADLFFEAHGTRSDQDIFIEELIDYLMGDSDRDGRIEVDQGEVYDYDGDGISPYNPATGAFDEDDWGTLDTYTDNYNQLNTQVPIGSYRLFDAHFDNHLDIDFNPDVNNLEVDGTDLDNQGLFDGLDINDDGDMDDWVSIDEKFVLPTGDITDDQFAGMVDRVSARAISFFMLPCFSGGFVDDLSAPNRVISTATEEETVSWCNLFTDLFTAAFHGWTRYGQPVNADADGNGYISMMEAFNYAAANDYYDEVPQYDDNGDGISHPYPIPDGGDGAFGANVYLQSPPLVREISIDIKPGSDPNTINCNAPRTIIPVAILTTADFDALTVDHTSVLFEGASEIHKDRKTGELTRHEEDVDHDGDLDLVFHFRLKDTTLSCSSTEATLTGLTYAGQAVEGHDSVTMLTTRPSVR